MPEPMIDKLWFSVSRVVAVKNDNDISTATGSFYQTDNKRFLVINRHVIFNESNHCTLDALRVLVHVDPSDLTKNEKLLIPLYEESGQPRWLEHPTHKSGIDMVAVNIDDILPSQSVIRFITPEDLFPNDYVMRFCEDCAVLGYPLGYYDDHHNLPILRDAMVSSPYAIGFRGDHYFLVDAKLHESSSGSPVFTKSQPGFKRRNGGMARGAGVGDAFLGIISTAVSTQYTDDKLDLYTVCFGHLVEQIASQDSNIQSLAREARSGCF